VDTLYGTIDGNKGLSVKRHQAKNWFNFR